MQPQKSMQFTVLSLVILYLRSPSEPDYVNKAGLPRVYHGQIVALHDLLLGKKRGGGGGEQL